MCKSLIICIQICRNLSLWISGKIWKQIIGVQISDNLYTNLSLWISGKIWKQIIGVQISQNLSKSVNQPIVCRISKQITSIQICRNQSKSVEMCESEISAKIWKQINFYANLSKSAIPIIRHLSIICKTDFDQLYSHNLSKSVKIAYRLWIFFPCDNPNSIF